MPRPSASTRCARAGIEVVVAGKRYGKGSSREHSPAAEKLAGVRLVIAESFERIYRQNADNIGLFTSTDFGLVDRIAGGRGDRRRRRWWPGATRWPPPSSTSGGLLRFGQRFMRDIDGAPQRERRPAAHAVREDRRAPRAGAPS